MKTKGKEGLEAPPAAESQRGLKILPDLDWKLCACRSYICLKGALFPNFHKNMPCGLMELQRVRREDPGTQKSSRTSEIRALFTPSQFLGAGREKESET